MINKELESVAEFHNSFGIDSKEVPTVKISKERKNRTAIQETHKEA